MGVFLATLFLRYQKHEFHKSLGHGERQQFEKRTTHLHSLVLVYISEVCYLKLCKITITSSIFIFLQLNVTYLI